MKNVYLVAIGLIISNIAFSQSQYFGQNKPRYKSFGFKVLQSPHFELYHYFKDNTVPNELMINSEHWYKIHQEVFKLAFIKPNPLIIYQNHPDFQETTAISGQIGEGTGGVTEGLRNRVVMPMMYSKRQTDHVLGHELVHAFQYQLMTSGDSTTLANIQNLPLFMVEGLAEYMSLGRVDAHTAMWMRDAVMNDDIPTIKDLVTKEYKYFPYRWGQAFWAYVAATYGDDMIRPLFKETARYGIEAAFRRNLKVDIDRFSARWKKVMTDTYAPLRVGTTATPTGREIASVKNAGEMNLSPTISPDGNFVAYISSKNVISLDIFIAEAHTGKVVRKIESTSFGSHVDSYSFLETAGAWSPDSRNLALVIQSKGRNKLSIVDVANGNKRTFELKGVDSFSNPAWSPDGSTIIVSGLMNGVSDLYAFNIKEASVQNLTNDEYSDIQPTWSPDGRSVYFVSDRGSNATRLEKASYVISKLDINTLKIESFSFLQGADNLNPLIDPNGNFLYFLSDADGFRNLYRYSLVNGGIEKLSNYFTGISGITMYSPAVSIAAKTGALVYSYFQAGKYNLYVARPEEFTAKPAENTIDKKAATLAPYEWKEGRNIVETNLNKQRLLGRVQEKGLKTLKYTPRFKLDYLGSSGVGVSTSRWGTGLGGGVVGLASDMLNNNQVSGVLALNGEIQDFGGQIAYLNQKNPLQWGASFSRIPYRFSDYQQTNKYITDPAIKASLGIPAGDSLIQSSYNLYRLFINEIGLFAFYPLSTSKRIEVGGSANWYSYSGRVYSDYYGVSSSAGSYYRGSLTPQRISQAELEGKGFSPFSLQKLYVAYVGDNSTFGTTAPLNGYRYRFEFSRYFGDIAHNAITADYRKYKYLKPITLAARLYYYGRLGTKNIEDYNRLYPMFLGYPWYMHGFWGKALSNQTSTLALSEEQLKGSQMGLTNFEIRLPFTGPKKLALIDFMYVPTDLNFFFDMGMVWDDARSPGKKYEYVFSDGEKQNLKLKPIMSTGVSLRINALGYLILEPYLAFPIYNGKIQSGVTGINFMIPGW
ncbi:tolB protein precursor [Emticicia fluvialis]|uniref:tolB protein precursor n=1 Tax=Emticicia fluvialis TaxID=2974474 RepID=UPI002165C666|nr:tolB protein precursor [Emticicia fluvialis]